MPVISAVPVLPLSEPLNGEETRETWFSSQSSFSVFLRGLDDTLTLSASRDETTMVFAG